MSSGLRASCVWQMWLYDPPSRETPSSCFVARKQDGTWEQIEEALERWARKAEGKRPVSTAVIIGLQTVKTGNQGEPHGFDVAKPVSGRKRPVRAWTPWA